MMAHPDITVRRHALAPTVLALPPPWPGRAPSPFPVARCRPLRRVLVATDGTDASRGALRLAALLAERDGAAVHVATVMERWGPPAPVHDFVSGDLMDAVGERVTHRLSRVLPQTQAVFGGTRRWRLRVLDGGVVPSIAAAADHAYDLILVGFRGRWMDRLLRRPTALSVARHAAVPVLAVPPEARTLPTRAVVGMDGGAAATAAARAAMRLVDAPAGVQLVRVLRAPAHADPAARLLAQADVSDADLIALGTHRPASLLDRMRRGVSDRVLAGARGCVLLAGQGAAVGCGRASGGGSFPSNEGE